MKQLQQQLMFGLCFATLAIVGCNKDKQISVSGTVTASSAAVANVLVTSQGAIIDTATTDAQGTYMIDVAKNGTLKFEKSGYNSLTKAVDGETTIDVSLTLSAFAAYFTTASNTVADPVFANNSIQPTATLPTATTPSNSWFTTTSYIGAIDPNGSAWYAGWSFYDNIVAGNLNSDAITLASTVVTVTDASLNGGADTIYWTNDKLYKLSGFVFVNSGKVLYIEAGTVVQGMAGTGSNASALIVARGAKIYAEGTSSQPIIFTFDGDAGSTSASTRGQWGGLIVLGNAPLNSAPGTTQIEGIPTNETRGNYGGNNAADNSGVIQYVSIRHGGTNIGADNEINGLTLGGVGSATVVDYVEVVGNSDDAVECFGGAVNLRHLILAYCADDAYDYDEGYTGNNQFVIIHQDPTSGNADRGGEHDGGTDPETAMPYAIPVFYNVTSVGNPASRALTFRDNAGGKYFNSIFVGYNKGVDIEDISSQSQDSYKQFEDGNLRIENCLFFNITAGSNPQNIFTVTSVE
jgi:hypothetical protein